jgi:nucleoside-diphosphate-sugar epimerase
MAKYLITGGAGFIGSHLAETLVKKVMMWWCWTTWPPAKRKT